jgi:multidrug efflux pump
MAQVPGIVAYPQAVQDIQIGARAATTQYQYVLTDSDAAELAEWAPQLLERLRALPALRDVASDQRDEGCGWPCGWTATARPGSASPCRRW